DRFDQLVRSALGYGFGPDLAGTAGAWRPFADLSETDDAYVVEVEVPGVARDDLTIEAIGGELVIHGEYKEKERKGLLRSTTRRVGRFEYRTLLPGEVDADRITARLSDGVLTVTVPKTEAVKPRRIEITAG